MKRYLWGRLVRSIISIFIVMSIVIALVYILIPRENAIKYDPQVSKLAGQPDKLALYKNDIYEQLGYHDFVTQFEMCANSDNPKDCSIKGSATQNKVLSDLLDKGYTIGETSDGAVYATRDYTIIELVYNFYRNIFVVDHPYAVKDSDNKDLERKVYFGKDFNGVPSIKCSGCEHKYLLYFDTSFPFIHQNFINLNLGKSYPTYQNIPVLTVISQGQGRLKQQKRVFENGKQFNSSYLLHTAKYKPTSTITRLDREKFDDNYVNAENEYENMSMISISYLFGVISLVISYLIAIPAAVIMARKKGKLADKIGIVYINVMIAVPSLAFIFFLKSIGVFMGLPDKFPQYGFSDIRSYILPALILGLLGTSGLMIWIRRYMIDQTSSDYVKFAKAKGLTQKEIYKKHIFKNAIIPIVNGIPASIILAIGGAVITETVFAIPGMGKMFPDAININNNSMIVALTFIFTSLSIFSTLLGDILMVFVDPRIQLNSKGDAR